MTDHDITLRRRPPLIATAAYFLVALSLCAAAYLQSLRSGYAQLAARAEVRLAQHNDKFLGQITRFQQLVSTLSKHTELTRAASGEDVAGLSDLLLSFALSTGAREIFLVDASGQLLVTSEAARSGTSEVLPSGNFIKTALDGGLGWSHGLADRDDPRTLHFARAIFAEDGPVIGAVGANVDVATLEFEWSFGPEPVAYFDRSGVAYVTNRPDLALRADAKLASHNSQEITETSDRILPMFAHTNGLAFGHQIWREVEGKVLSENVLVLDKYLPRIDLTGRIFQDTKAAEERALLIAAITGLTVALAGLLLWATWVRRESLARQLRLEEATNLELEARVGRRTEELQNTRDQLVAVSRLSALGEMSAGISHELNQPLAAIRYYAENGRKFLARGDSTSATENFDSQIGQIDRIGRIIRSLRAFARNEPQEMTNVDFSAVTMAALSVSDLRLTRENIRLETSGLETPIMVRAGQVRLQQVIVNIIGNAVEALDGSRTKLIRIRLNEEAEYAELTISDNGPGIAEPDKVFDPFFSTKDPGGSSGMGLGLSISHGIVGSFGGNLACRNLPEGGAEFSVRLPLESLSE